MFVFVVFVSHYCSHCRFSQVWAELEEKNLKPDAWAENTYNTKRAELMQKEKSEAVSG